MSEAGSYWHSPCVHLKNGIASIGIFVTGALIGNACEEAEYVSVCARHRICKVCPPNHYRLCSVIRTHEL